jgi:hypothetical protein
MKCTDIVQLVIWISVCAATEPGVVAITGLALVTRPCSSLSHHIHQEAARLLNYLMFSLAVNTRNRHRDPAAAEEIVRVRIPMSPSIYGRVIFVIDAVHLPTTVFGPVTTATMVNGGFATIVSTRITVAATLYYLLRTKHGIPYTSINRDATRCKLDLPR